MKISRNKNTLRMRFSPQLWWYLPTSLISCFKFGIFKYFSEKYFIKNIIKHELYYKSVKITLFPIVTYKSLNISINVTTYLFLKAHINIFSSHVTDFIISLLFIECKLSYSLCRANISTLKINQEFLIPLFLVVK